MSQTSVKNARKIPDVVIEERLPKYLLALSRLQEDWVEVVSSDELAKILNCSSVLIRKDLAYFGRFGRQRKGYYVTKLLDELRHICGVDRQWNMALVGVGGIGRTILAYDRFDSHGFKIVAAFDTDSERIGQRIERLTVKGMDELPECIRKENIHIGIVAVPAPEAQTVIESLESAGVKAVLNYTPIIPRTDNALIVHVNPILKLQSLSYFLRQMESPEKQS